MKPMVENLCEHAGQKKAEKQFRLKPHFRLHTDPTETVETTKDETTDGPPPNKKQRRR